MGRHFWLFVTGRAISILGDGFGTLAISLFVYQITGSKLAMGSLFLMALVPAVVLRFVGSPLIDRVNRVRLLRLLDTISFIAYLMPFVLSLTGHLQLWHLFALEFVSGLASALYQPAVVATLPALVQPEQLARANAIVNGALRGMAMVGPVFAGFVTNRVGSPTALLLDAFTFLISALLLSLFPTRIGAVERRTGGKTSYLQDLTTGFRFFGQVPALLVLCLMLGVSFMSAWAIYAMTAPYVVETLHAGAGVLGLMEGFWPFGFFLGSAWMTYRGDFRQRRPVLLISLIASGVALSGLAYAKPNLVPLALACKLVEGCSFAVFSTIITTIFQRLVPNELRGRVFSAQLLISYGANPLGAFLGAVMAQRYGIGRTFILAGLVPIIVGALGFALPSLRAVDGDLKPVAIS